MPWPGFRRSALACNELRRNNPRGNVQAGFAYVALLILLVILGMVGASLLQLGVVAHRRTAEQALLDIGAAYGDALESYRKLTPTGQPDAPTALRDLLKDPRFAAPVRHLRQLYADPITGATEWGIVTARGQPGIIGIHSLSRAKPIKIGNFSVRFKGFESKPQYADWIFLRLEQPGAPGSVPATAVPATAPVQVGADQATALPGISLFGPTATPLRASPVLPVLPVPPALASPAGAAPILPWALPATIVPTSEPPEAPGSDQSAPETVPASTQSPAAET
jgi:type II secretory pathway pseudopilin PulG